jgi:hypothetical protein
MGFQLERILKSPARGNPPPRGRRMRYPAYFGKSPNREKVLMKLGLSWASRPWRAWASPASRALHRPCLVPAGDGDVEIGPRAELLRCGPVGESFGGYVFPVQGDHGRNKAGRGGKAWMQKRPAINRVEKSACSLMIPPGRKTPRVAGPSRFPGCQGPGLIPGLPVLPSST